MSSPKPLPSEASPIPRDYAEMPRKASGCALERKRSKGVLGVVLATITRQMRSSRAQMAIRAEPGIGWAYLSPAPRPQLNFQIYLTVLQQLRFQIYLTVQIAGTTSAPGGGYARITSFRPCGSLNVFEPVHPFPWSTWLPPRTCQVSGIPSLHVL